MSRLILLRHGLTQENREERIQGQLPGTLLVAETEQYLTAITPLIRKHNPTLLMSSDLKRAVQTREMLAEFLELPELKQAELALLRERSMGSLEGGKWSEVEPAVHLQRHTRSYDFRPWGGECDDDVRARVAAALWYFIENDQHERLCVITHAGWLHQLAYLAPHAHRLPTGWMNRTAIYEAHISPVGHVESFTPLPLHASLGH